MSCSTVVVVAIVGASGSGKSELSRLVKARLIQDDDVVVVETDRYWITSEANYSTEILNQMHRCEYNRDHPDHYDLSRCAHDVRRLAQQNSIILVEGILVLENDELRDMVDLTVFCDCDIDSAGERRIMRDRANKGEWKYGGEAGRLAYYEKFVKPGYFRFILPRKAKADFIVSNNSVDGPLEENQAINRLVEMIQDLVVRKKDNNSFID